MRSDFSLNNAQDILAAADHKHVWSHGKGMDQPGKVANPARGQLNRENEYFLVRVRA